MHTMVMGPGYLGIEPGFLYRFNRGLYETITSSHLELHTKPGRIKGYKLMGVTYQAADPTPEYPQEIQGVGTKTKNLFDMNAWYDFFYSKRRGF